MLLNGLPASEISLQDRGLAYGDGLFETILVSRRTPILLERHYTRLRRGCERLGLDLDLKVLVDEVAHLLSSAPVSDAVLKIVVTRQAQGRGYRPLTRECNRILTFHPLPDYRSQNPELGIAMFVCQQRLGRQPALAGIKHLNRLEQVLAAQEWPAESFLEGLMLDTEGFVIEGTRTNLFMAKAGTLYTPELNLCGVEGVLRAALIDHFGTAKVTPIRLDSLDSADELFIANSVNGVWPVTQLRHGDRVRTLPVGQWALAAQSFFKSLLP